MPGMKSASEATYNSTLELDIPDLFSQSDTTQLALQDRQVLLAYVTVSK